MRLSKPSLYAAALLALVTASASIACAHGPALTQTNLEIIDRTEGRVLPIYWHGGRRYVVGKPGNEYAVRMRNGSSGRVLAVMSVDGVNVITGDTASPRQSGYVLSPYESTEIAGWRTSLSRTAAFYFTSLPDSYAARTGRPDNVGVIGVAVFAERAPPIALGDFRRKDAARDQAKTAQTPASPSAAARNEAARARAYVNRLRASEPVTAAAKPRLRATRRSSGRASCRRKRSRSTTTRTRICWRRACPSHLRRWRISSPILFPIEGVSSRIRRPSKPRLTLPPHGPPRILGGPCPLPQRRATKS